MADPSQLKWVLSDVSENDYWFGVTYGNGLFVAVAIAGDNRVMTSHDGINWTPIKAIEGDWSSICYGNGLFVAVEGSFSGTKGVMTSPDGINWTKRTPAAYHNWRSVCYGNGMFVAVANSGAYAQRIMISYDGINWGFPEKLVDGGGWQSICCGNGLFVAIAFNDANHVITSSDGLNWTAQQATTISGHWRDICYGNGLFVVVGEYSPDIFPDIECIMTSPDGFNWTAQEVYPTDLYKAIACGDGLFVVVGTEDITLVSPDGVNWHEEPFAENRMTATDICYGDGKFVVITSSDSGKTAAAQWPALYQFAHGSGTEQDPYQVWTANDLNGIRDHSGSHFIQMRDIDLAGYGWETIRVFGQYGEIVFIMKYNGNGKVVKHLDTTMIERLAGSTITDWGLEDLNNGRLANNFYGNKLHRFYTTGNVESPSFGGLAQNWPTDRSNMDHVDIQDCFSLCDIELPGDYDSIGDANDAAPAAMFNNFAYTFPVTTTERCYYAGNVTASVNGNLQTIYTGLVGSIYDHPGNSFDFSNSYVKRSMPATGTPTFPAMRTETQMKQKSTYENWDFDTIWDIDGVTNDGYPFLRVQAAEEPEEPNTPDKPAEVLSAPKAYRPPGSYVTIIS